MISELAGGIEADLEEFTVPGASWALIEGSRILHEDGLGPAAVDRDDPVTPATLFQACSISKPVAVFAMLRLVDRGILDLDADVNDRLTSWRIPPLEAWQPVVTLRQLVSHSAGLTTSGFPGYRAGAALPTTVAVLDGVEPANTFAHRRMPRWSRRGCLPMSDGRRWSPGEVIVLQDVYEDKLWAARPVIVVEDSADLLALWCPQGTVRKVPVTPGSMPAGVSRSEWLARALTRRDWPLEDAAWDVSSLMLHREGDWHAVWLSFLETGEQWGWYVNFQEPYRRTERGIQTMDLALDIIAEPDRRSWRWKDEDEFTLLIERGVLGSETAAQVRREADVVIGRIERDEPPFDSAWPRWTPDPTWELPALPDGWEIL